MSGADRERWDARYRVAAGSGRPAPPAVLEAASPWLGAGGTALDVACGPGAGALWLAARGFVVDAVDISPVALGMLAEEARERGLAERVRVIEADLDDGLPPEAGGAYDVVACLWFRWAPLGRVAAERLRAGGLVVAAVLSAVGRDARAGGDGPDPRFLAAPGELVALLEGFEVLHHEEGGGQASVVARRV